MALNVPRLTSAISSGGGETSHPKHTDSAERIEDTEDRRSLAVCWIALVRACGYSKVRLFSLRYQCDARWDFALPLTRIRVLCVRAGD